jgi:hypothetical protein
MHHGNNRGRATIIYIDIFIITLTTVAFQRIGCRLEQQRFDIGLSGSVTWRTFDKCMQACITRYLFV